MSDTAIVTLRRARSSDRATLERWDREPHVLASGAEAWPWEELSLDPQPAWCDWLIAEADGRPIGFLQIMDPGLDDQDAYWGPDVGSDHRAIDIWIGEKDALARGFGTQMMQQAIARCFAEPGVIAILIDPLITNTAAHRFYESVGFSQIDRRMFGEDDCYVYRLTRQEWRQETRNA